MSRAEVESTNATISVSEGVGDCHRGAAPCGDEPDTEAQPMAFADELQTWLNRPKPATKARPLPPPGPPPLYSPAMSGAKEDTGEDGMSSTGKKMLEEARIEAARRKMWRLAIESDSREREVSKRPKRRCSQNSGECPPDILRSLDGPSFDVVAFEQLVDHDCAQIRIDSTSLQFPEAKTKTIFSDDAYRDRSGLSCSSGSNSGHFARGFDGCRNDNQGPSPDDVAARCRFDSHNKGFEAIHSSYSCSPRSRRKTGRSPGNDFSSSDGEILGHVNVAGGKNTKYQTKISTGSESATATTVSSERASNMALSLASFNTSPAPKKMHIESLSDHGKSQAYNLPWVDNASNGSLHGMYTGPVNDLLQPHGEGFLILQGNIFLKFYGSWENGNLTSPLMNDDEKRERDRWMETSHMSKRGRQGGREDRKSPPVVSASSENCSTMSRVKPDTSKSANKPRRSRQQKPKYKIGEVARTPRHMAIRRTKENAFQSASLIKKFDHAFLKRSNGLWWVIKHVFLSFSAVQCTTYLIFGAT
ncbi:hypothetical protein ACHAWF_005162 [Thalassiosira exigua]